jgi:hypothetical protein
MLEAIEKAKAARGVGLERCRCGKWVTIKPAVGGLSLDVLHPQPPCHEFKMFVQKLIELADGQQL